MMRSKRPSAAAAACTSHTHARHARAKTLARARSARTCDPRPAANGSCLCAAAWVLLECCLGDA
eukprot:7344662-Lingulodinium_polyedra.AAC.1